MPNQFGPDQGLTPAEAYAACGPAAAVAFARANGRNPTLREAVDLAKTVGWNPDQGMAGPGSQQQLLAKMGVPARLEHGVDWAKVQADVQNGNPVIVDTPGHYFVATDFNPETGAFNFGASGTALRRGSTWMTPAQMNNVGMGQARAALYIDHPDTPGPSVATVAPTNGVQRPAPTPPVISAGPPVDSNPSAPTDELSRFRALTSGNGLPDLGTPPSQRPESRSEVGRFRELTAASAPPPVSTMPARRQPSASADLTSVQPPAAPPEMSVASAPVISDPRDAGINPPSLAPVPQPTAILDPRDAGVNPPLHTSPSLGEMFTGQDVTTRQPGFTSVTAVPDVAQPAETGPLDVNAGAEPLGVTKSPGPATVESPLPPSLGFSAVGGTQPGISAIDQAMARSYTEPITQAAVSQLRERGVNVAPADEARIQRQLETLLSPSSLTLLALSGGAEAPAAAAGYTAVTGVGGFIAGHVAQELGGDQTAQTIAELVGGIAAPIAGGILSAAARRPSLQAAQQAARQRTGAQAAYDEITQRAIEQDIRAEIEATIARNEAQNRGPNWRPYEAPSRNEPAVTLPAAPSTDFAIEGEVGGNRTLGAPESPVQIPARTPVQTGEGTTIAAEGGFGPPSVVPSESTAARLQRETATERGLNPPAEYPQLPAPRPAATGEGTTIEAPAAARGWTPDIITPEPPTAPLQLGAGNPDTVMADTLDQRAENARLLGNDNEYMALRQAAKALRNGAGEETPPVLSDSGARIPPVLSDSGARIPPVLSPADDFGKGAHTPQGPVAEPGLKAPVEQPSLLSSADMRPQFGGTQHRENFAVPASADRGDIFAAAHEQQGEANLPPAEQMRRQGAAELFAAPPTMADLRPRDLTAEARVVPVTSIKVDPDRFQFKLGGGSATGASSKLKDVKQWNDRFAGTLYGWEAPNGDIYVVNGHHRLDLANRLGVKAIRMVIDSAADGVTDTEARVIGALTNISEGQGTPIDVAKFLRETKLSVADMAEAGVSPSGKLAREGTALGQLSEPLWLAVTRGELSEPQGILIGQYLGDKPAVQGEIGKMIQAQGLTDRQLKALLEEATNAETVSMSQETLFGTVTEDRSNLLAKAKIRAYVEEQLAKDRRLFSYVIAGNRPSELARGGNLVDVAQSGALASESAQFSDAFNRLANYRGPVADALTEGANDAIREPAQHEAIARQTLDRVRTALREESGAGAGRPVPPEPRQSGLAPATPEVQPARGAAPELASPSQGERIRSQIADAEAALENPGLAAEQRGSLQDEIQRLYNRLHMVESDQPNMFGSLPGVASHVAGAAVGGAVGNAVTPESATPEERTRNLALGAAAGTGLSIAAGRMFRLAPVQSRPFTAPAGAATGPGEAALRQSAERAFADPKPPTPGLLQKLDNARRALGWALFRDDISLTEWQHRVERAYGGPLPDELRAAELMRTLHGGPDGAAQVFVEQRLGPIVASVGDDRAALNQYLSLKDNLDKAAAIERTSGAQVADVRKFSGDLTRAESQAALDALEQNIGPVRWQALETAGRQIQDEYVNPIRDWLASAGVLDPNMVAAWKSEFPNYIRSVITKWDDVAPNLPWGRKVGLGDAGWKHLTAAGTESARETPLASLISMAGDAAVRARRNEVGRAINEWRQISPEFDQVARLLGPGDKLRAEEVSFSFLENGQKQTIALPRALATLAQFEPPELMGASGLFMKIIAGGRDFTSLTAVRRNPVFALAKNLGYDVPSTILHETGRYGLQAFPEVVISTFQGYAEALKGLNVITGGTINSPVFQRMLSQYAGQQGYHWGGLGNRDRLARQLGRDGIVVEKAVDLLPLIDATLGFGWVENIGGRLENGPRIGAGLMAERRGASSLEQSIRYRTVTQDFGQGGALTKVLNMGIPFFNVGFQAGPWMADMARRNPKGALAAFTSFVVGPAIAAEAWNRSDPERSAAYDDIPPYLKQRGIIIMLPGELTNAFDEQGRPKHTPLMIPMRDPGGIVGLAREAALRTIQAGGGAPEAQSQNAQELLAGLVGTLSPLSIESGPAAVGQALPFGLKTGVGLATGRNLFTGGYIDSAARNDSALRPSQAIAEQLGRATGTEPKPGVVEYALRDLTSGLGGVLLAAADLAARAKNGEPMMTNVHPQPGDVPVVGGLTRGVLPTTGGAVDQHLRTLYDETHRQYLSELLDAVKENPALAKAPQKELHTKLSAAATELAQVAVYGLPKDPAAELSKINDAYRLLTPEVRAQKLAEVRQLFAKARKQARPQQMQETASRMAAGLRGGSSVVTR